MPGPTPLVSIVVPSYNAAPYLPPLCRSLQAQKFQDFEVLIGDDASTDGTREAVAPFLTDPRFHFWRWEQNRGVARSTLFLLQQARGEYWGYPGADDLYEPGFLEERLAFLSMRPEVGIVHGPPTLIDESGAVLAEHSENSPIWQLPWPEREILGPAETLALLLQHNVINTPSVLIRMAVTRAVLPRMESEWRYAQDWFYWILHAATGCSLGFDRRPLHRYRIVRASLTNDPRKAAVRWAEIRLVPLSALSRAAEFSAVAGELWGRWRGTLYALWLRRAFSLARQGSLSPAWLQAGARAFHGGESRPVSLVGELLRHAGAILGASRRERRARASQAILVSGLAELDLPRFRRGKDPVGPVPPTDGRLNA